MAIGTVTLLDSSAYGGGVPSAPTFLTSLSFAGEASYPTGGMLGLGASLKAQVKDNRAVKGIIPLDCGGYVIVWVPSTSAVKVYYCDYDAGADGPLVEVPNATDLSAVTFRMLVVAE